MKHLSLLLLLFVIFFATTFSFAEEQQEVGRDLSWTRFGLKWIKSISESMQYANDALEKLVTDNDNDDDQTSNGFFKADPIRSLASAATSLVGGRHSVSTQRTTLPQEDRQIYERFHQERNREKVAAKQQQQKMKRTTSKNNNEQEMLLDDEEEENDIATSAKTQFLYKTSKLQFSKKIIAQQEQLNRKLNNNDQNQNQLGVLVTGNPTTITQHPEENNNNLVFNHQNTHNNNNDERRVAEILATTPQPATRATRAPNLVLTQDVFASFCSLGGVTAIEFSPSMNFTCYRDGTEASNFTVNGSTYADNSIFETELNRTNCVPSDLNGVSKYCICPFDKVLLRASTGEYFCWGYNYNCNLNVTEPRGFQQAKEDALKNSLGLGVPLRIPYVDTIDRRSTTPVQVKIAINCSPIPWTADASTQGSTLILPSQYYKPSSNTSKLVGVYFGNLRSNEFNNSGSVVGDYTSLRKSIWNYRYSMTEKPASSSTSGNTTTPTTTNVDDYTFLVTPNNFLAQTTAVYLRPHSFLNFADFSGSKVVRIGSTDTSIVGPGVLVGGSNITFSFTPSALGDGFYAGRQLYVETGMVTGYDASAENNILGAGVGNQRGTTPFAELITYDILNGPPLLKKAPKPPLATSTIVLITLGVVCVIAGIVAIVVAVIRRRNLKLRKIQKKQERKELRERVMREMNENEREASGSETDH